MNATDEVMADVAKAVEPAMERLGDEVIADVRQLIGVPVEFDGHHVIRSLPGEPPRKESGDLSEHVTRKVEAGLSDQYTLTVTLEMFYADFLNAGTSRMARRPFVEPTEAKWRGIVDARLSELLK